MIQLLRAKLGYAKRELCKFYCAAAPTWSSVLEGRPRSSMQSPCQRDSLVSFTHFWMVLPFPSSISQNILFPAMELAEDNDGKCVELNVSHTSV